MQFITRKAYREGRLPKPQDFPLALAEFENRCVLPFLGKEVVGGFAYGSVCRSDCTVASDIDYLLVIAEEDHDGAVRAAVADCTRDYAVVVQPRVIEKTEGLTGQHGMETAFIDHLELTTRLYGYHGENPLAYIAVREEDFVPSLQDSARMYVRGLKSSFTSASVDEIARLELLRKIAEKPFHSMRKALQFVHGHELYHGLLQSDTKQEILRVYRTIPGAEEQFERIERIDSAVKGYVRALQLRPSNAPMSECMQAYDDSCAAVEDCYRDALHLMQWNARLMG